MLWRGKKVRIGMEASGHARWFERLLAELQFVWIGYSAVFSYPADWPDRTFSSTMISRNYVCRFSCSAISATLWVRCAL